MLETAGAGHRRGVQPTVRAGRAATCAACAAGAARCPPFRLTRSPLSRRPRGPTAAPSSRAPPLRLPAVCAQQQQQSQQGGASSSGSGAGSGSSSSGASSGGEAPMYAYNAGEGERRQKATLEHIFKPEAPGSDSEPASGSGSSSGGEEPSTSGRGGSGGGSAADRRPQAPWALGWQMSERNIVWNDDLKMRLIRVSVCPCPAPCCVPALHTT